MDKAIEFVFLGCPPHEFIHVLKNLLLPWIKNSQPHLSLHLIPQGVGVRFLIRGQFYDQTAIWDHILSEPQDGARDGPRGSRMPKLISAAFAVTAEPQTNRRRGTIAHDKASWFYFFVTYPDWLTDYDFKTLLDTVLEDALVELYSADVSHKTREPGKDGGIEHYGPKSELQQSTFHTSLRFIGLVAIPPSDEDPYLVAATLRNQFYDRILPIFAEKLQRKAKADLLVEIVPARILHVGSEYLSPGKLLQDAVDNWKKSDSRNFGTIKFSWWPDVRIPDAPAPVVEIPCGPLALMGRAQTGKSVLASHILAYAAMNRCVGDELKPLRVVYLSYKISDPGCAKGVDEIAHLAYAWHHAFNAPIEIVRPDALATHDLPEPGSLLYAEMKGEYTDAEHATQAIINHVALWGDTLIVFDEVINFCTGCKANTLLKKLSLLHDNNTTQKIFPVLIAQQLPDFFLPELETFSEAASVVITALNGAEQNRESFKRIQDSRDGRIYPEDLTFKEVSSETYETGTFWLSLTAGKRYGFIPQKYPKRSYPANHASICDKLRKSGIAFGFFSWEDFCNTTPE